MICKGCILLLFLSTSRNKRRQCWALSLSAPCFVASETSSSKCCARRQQLWRRAAHDSAGSHVRPCNRTLTNVLSALSRVFDKAMSDTKQDRDDDDQSLDVAVIGDGPDAEAGDEEDDALDAALFGDDDEGAEAEPADVDEAANMEGLWHGCLCCCEKAIGRQTAVHATNAVQTPRNLPLSRSALLCLVIKQRTLQTRPGNKLTSATSAYALAQQHASMLSVCSNRSFCSNLCPGKTTTPCCNRHLL